MPDLVSDVFPFALINGLWVFLAARSRRREGAPGSMVGDALVGVGFLAAVLVSAAVLDAVDAVPKVPFVAPLVIGVAALIVTQRATGRR